MHEEMGYRESGINYTKSKIENWNGRTITIQQSLRQIYFDLEKNKNIYMAFFYAGMKIQLVTFSQAEFQKSYYLFIYSFNYFV